MPRSSRRLASPASRVGARPWLSLLLSCLLALPWTLVVSCASWSHRPRGAFSEVARAQPETRVGVVRAIGAEQRFVLIETPSASATASLTKGQLLHCRLPVASGRAAVADLRVSRERHQALIVANVVAGEPAIDGIVYTDPGVPTPATARESISAASTAPLPGLFPPPKP